MSSSRNQRARLESLDRKLSNTSSFAEAAEAFVSWAREFTGAGSATIRLAHRSDADGEWLPVCVHQGLGTDTLLRPEVAVPSGECLCGKVARGAGDDSALFTSGGAFASGKAQSLNEETNSEALGRLRGRCIQEGFESLAVVPLTVGRRRVGVLHLADHERDRFSGLVDTLEAAGRLAGEVLASREGPEWEHASRGFLEAALLPTEPPTVPGLDIGVSFVTASRFSQMGGDFYDLILRSDGSAMLFVGDYSGRGMEAAGMANEVRQLMADLAPGTEGPAQLLEDANRILSGVDGVSAFVTAAVCLIEPDTGRLTISLAGHPPPVLLSAGMAGGDTALQVDREVGTDGARVPISELETPFRRPMGVEPDAGYRPVEHHLEPSDVLILFTDGVTEARRGGRLFGIRGVEEACRACGRALPDLAATICGQSSAYHDPSLEADDRLVLAVRRTG